MAHQLLVVDDSATVLRALQVTFATEPFAVETASTSADGLAKAREHQPAVILVDVRLGGIDGYMLCQGFKNDPATQNAKVILMGSKAKPVDESRARSVGADAHMTKPFETQGVIDQVKRLVGESTVTAPNPIPGGKMRPAAGFTPAPTPAPSPQADPAVATPRHVSPGFFGELAAATNRQLVQTTTSAPGGSDTSSLGQPSQAPSPPRRDDLRPTMQPSTPTPQRPAASPRFSPALDIPSESTFSRTGSPRTPGTPAPSFPIRPPAASHQPRPSTRIPNAPSLASAVPNSRPSTAPTSTPPPSSPASQTRPTFDPSDSFSPSKMAHESTGPEVVTPSRKPTSDDPLAALGPAADTSQREVIPSHAPPVATPTPHASSSPPAGLKVPASPPSEVATPASSSEDQVTAEALTVAREVIERVAWEVVPRLAETMIREHIERLVDAQKNT